jgi:hypothetical protein
MHRDDLDRARALLGQRAQVALHSAAAAAPVEHLHHPLAVDGRLRDELAAAAVLGLVERQPPRWPRRATRLKLGARHEHEVGWIRVRSSESLRSDRANRGSRVAVRLEIADHGLTRASSASEVEVV